MPTEIKVLQRGDELMLMNVAPNVFDNPPDEKLCNLDYAHSAELTRGRRAPPHSASFLGILASY